MGRKERTRAIVVVPGAHEDQRKSCMAPVRQILHPFCKSIDLNTCGTGCIYVVFPNRGMEQSWNDPGAKITS